MRDFISLELDGAAVNRVITNNRVEQRGLATAVRPNNASDRSFLDGHRDVDIRLHPAIGLGNILNLND